MGQTHERFKVGSKREGYVGGSEESLDPMYSLNSCCYVTVLT